MNAVRKKTAAVEWRTAPPKFTPPSDAELQARHLECLEICGDWKEELERRQRRLLLRSEMIGGVSEEEVEELRADFDRLAQCMRVLAWRPRDDS
jgi:hypothetical protein